MRRTARFLAAFGMTLIQPSMAEGSVDLALESRTFAEKPRDDVQQPERHNLSASVSSEYAAESAGGVHSLLIEGFARLDQSDGERTYADARDLYYRYTAESYEVRAGLRRVFWGVTESAHLVDVVNQSHFAENLDGEDKLGQPSLDFAWILDSGKVEFFVLPYFRERPFPGEAGRLRPFLPVRTDNAIYESSSEKRHVDLATRYAQSFGGWDFGLSYFRGTARDPRLLFAADEFVVDTRGVPLECGLPPPLAPDNCAEFVTVTARNPHLIPAYDQIRQVGLELQRLWEGWLLKLEAIHRDSEAQRYAAAAAGVEYTVGNVYESGADLTAVLEYLYDERGSLDPDSAQGRAQAKFARGMSFNGAEAQQLQGLRPRSFSPFQNDLFLGLRVALNDEPGTEMLIGGIVDIDTQATLASVEASRRLGEDYRLAAELRAFGSLPVTDPLWSFERDSYLQIELTRYF